MSARSSAYTGSSACTIIVLLLCIPGSVWSQVFAPSDTLVGLAGNHGLIIDGATVNDLTGTALTSGDFNGDGYADIAIGAPYADVLRDGVMLNAVGATFVIYAGPDRDLAGFDLDSLRPENGGDGSRGFVVLGESPAGFLGRSLANVGDVNGDGIDDLLIGAPNVGVSEFAGFTFGAAYLIFGHQGEDYPALLDVSVLRPEGDENNNSGYGVAMLGSQLSGNAGFSVAAAGDVSGDGVGDMLIGNDYALGGGNRGLTFLIYGRTADQPWPGLIQLADFQSNGSDGSQGVALLSNLTGDSLGISVAGVGDFTGDGIDDFLVGAPLSNILAPGGGMAALVPGQISGPELGFDTNLDLRNPENKETVYFMSSANAGDAIGAVVAGIGDINGDGRPDLAIGSPIAQSQAEEAGLVYVVFGRQANRPLSKSFSLTRLLPANGGDGSLGFAIAGAAFDNLGSSLAGIGDINGDGLTDLLIGATGLVANGSATGGAFIIYGRAQDDPFPALITTTSLVAGDGGRGFALTGEQTADQAGFAVAYGGDINGDGGADILISANSANGAAERGGRTYVIFGAGNDVPAGPVADGRLTHAWYDPARAGEGIVTEFGLRDGEPSFFAAWYTYIDGEQLWLSTGVPQYSNDGLSIETTLYLTAGGHFGADFDPELISVSTWGSVRVQITNCNALIWNYQSLDASQSGVLNFIPALPDLLGLSGCREVAKQAKGFVFGSGVGAELSGAWWHPNRAGEGIIVDIEDRGGQPTVFLSWFTYAGGVQRWLVGSSVGIDLSSNELTDIPLVVTTGGQFGEDFDPAQVISQDWGTATLKFTSCNSAVLDYSGQFPGGSTLTGRLELVRFTDGLEDYACTD